MKPMRNPDRTSPDAYHRFAWDGLSFDVPAQWNLSSYTFGRRSNTVEMEDDVELRLQLEWVNLRGRLEIGKVQKRYAAQAKAVTEAAETVEPVGGLPEGWHAFAYSMRERRRLLTAFFLAPDASLFCFFVLHFGRSGRGQPARVILRLAGSFAARMVGEAPWSFYDVAFTLDRGFRLANTSLQSGRKLLVFHWRMRRLFLWFFSLADVLLKERDIQSWAVEFLNGFKLVRGPRFVPGEDGAIVANRRRFRYPFGHYEEIGRQCFRYHVQYVHDRSQNRVVLLLYHYRRGADLSMLPVVTASERRQGPSTGKHAEPPRRVRA
ncbi:MAG: hypothetical protein JXR37_02355 [Kiritimatiellae bacterium]|nr:hypothetical protein [Kiritimatiellia bacterium]